MGKTRHNHKHFEDEYEDDESEDVNIRKRQDDKFRRNRGQKQRSWYDGIEFNEYNPENKETLKR